MQDTKETMAHHLHYGTSGEYTVEDDALFSRILDGVKTLNMSVYELGGTSFVLALRASKIGCRTLLTLPLTKSQ
jgi:hypothetical protein